MIGASVGSVSADLLTFRSIDGSGNNVANPTMGAADTQIVRINYEAFYPDAQGIVTEKESGMTMQVPALPNPRLIRATRFRRRANQIRTLVA